MSMRKEAIFSVLDTPQQEQFLAQLPEKEVLYNIIQKLAVAFVPVVQ
jgi:hypothetical protein